MKEKMELAGRVTLQLSDRHGRIIHQQQQPNRIVTSGRQLVAELFTGEFSGPPPTRVSHMAVGTAGAVPTPTPVSDADSQLVAERSPRKPISVIRAEQIVEVSIIRYHVLLQAVFEFDEANNPTVPLREAGVFNADSAGVMYNRVIFEPVTKTDAFKLTLFWAVVF